MAVVPLHRLGRQTHRFVDLPPSLLTHLLALPGASPSRVSPTHPDSSVSPPSPLAAPKRELPFFVVLSPWRIHQADIIHLLFPSPCPGPQKHHNEYVSQIWKPFLSRINTVIPAYVTEDCDFCTSLERHGDVKLPWSISIL